MQKHSLLMLLIMLLYKLLKQCYLSTDTEGNRAVHYNDVIISAMASQITSLTIVYSTVYSGADQRKHQSSASLAFVRGIHRWPVNSPHKGPVTRKMFLFIDVIMEYVEVGIRWRWEVVRDDIMAWNPLSAFLAFPAGNPLVTAEFPSGKVN